MSKARSMSESSDDRPAHALIAEISDTTAQKNLQLLMLLRWFAVVGQIAAIVYVHFWLGITLPLPMMAAVVVLLICLNCYSLIIHRDQETVSNSELFFELLMDIGGLTIQLYLSGGATNPFIMLYLLQVALGAVLLEAKTTWLLVGVTSLCFVWLTEVHEAIVIPDMFGGTLANLHVQGLFICFILGAGLIVYFISRIARNLRARDQNLADLRQRSLEEDHIVRLGLMASGAAHELGTPLATLSVILNDWQHMPVFRDDPVLIEEIDEMQAQLGRCKAILTGILMSSGEVRGEETLRTSVRQFFDGLSDEWRASRAPTNFVYINRVMPDIVIVSDTALKQIIFNVLDNALESSPAWMRMDITRQTDDLVIVVTDRGLGFSDAMLQAFGKPYQSSKNRPGRGLGLFLVVNVVRKLGGTVVAKNHARGGAEVSITLPLKAISTEASND